MISAQHGLAACMQVNSVRMRRHLTSKDFRGSVFVEFIDEDTSEQVLRFDSCLMSMLLCIY